MAKNPPKKNPSWQSVFPPGFFMTPEERRALAKQIAEDSLTPQRKLIEAERARSQREALQEGQALEGFAKAAAELSKGIAPSLYGAYGGGDVSAMYQKGLSDGEAAISYMGGSLPASARATERDALAGPTTGFFTRAPYHLLNKAATDRTAISWRSQEQQDDFGKQLSALEAQRPGLIRTGLRELESDENQRWATWVQAQYLLNTQRQTDANLTGVDPRTGQPLPGYQVTPSGQVIPPGYEWDPEANRIVKAGTVAARDKARQEKEAARTKARTKAVGNREGEIGSITQKAYSDIAKGKPFVVVREVPVDPTKPWLGTKKEEIRMPFEKARQLLFNKYGQAIVAKYASSAGKAKLRARIFKVIDQALVDNGFVPKAAPAKPPKKSPTKPPPRRGGV